MMENLGNDYYFYLGMIISGIIWIIGYTSWLIFGDREQVRETSSLDIFLSYTGGTLLAAFTGWLIVVGFIVFVLPVHLLNIARGKTKWNKILLP